jgi:hypothetical protein
MEKNRGAILLFWTPQETLVRYNVIKENMHTILEELDGPAVSSLRRAIAEAKQRWSIIGWVTKNLISRTPPHFGRHRWLHLQSFAPTNPHWARVVGYGLFSLCVIHKEGLCPSSGDITDDDNDECNNAHLLVVS